MQTHHIFHSLRRVRPVLAAALLSGGALIVGATAAEAATVGTFAGGVLTVSGDGTDNTITISRNAAGGIRINGGAVQVVGGNPTVANVTRISVFVLGGNDVVTLDETNGALPVVEIFGGDGNDTLTGGSGADLLFGQSGNDTLLGKGGVDQLFGGHGNDAMTGGDADDQAFGQGGDDRMIWNPGDDTDLDEGGTGTDTVEVNGGHGGEQFTTTANGARVRFDRINPAPFSLDIGTSEALVVNANDGADTFSTTGNLATLIQVTVDGGGGADQLIGSNGADTLVGGGGADLVNGRQGNDTAFLGDGDDTFQWDPGDGSDTVEGQNGTDTLLFNGSNANERMDVSANGGRIRFTRDIASIVMDTNDVEAIDVNPIGGADAVTVNDMTGTDLTLVDVGLSASDGTDDQAADNVIVDGTSGADVVVLDGQNRHVDVSGLATRVAVTGAAPGSDRVTVNALGSDDVVDASGVAANTAQLSLNGGAGDDVMIGGAGDDTITGGVGDDVLLGGPGNDVLDGGDGDDIEIEGATALARTTGADSEWIAAHASTVDGKTMLDLGDRSVTLPAADISQL